LTVIAALSRSKRGDYAGSVRRPARRKPTAVFGKPAHGDDVFDPHPDRTLGWDKRERLVNLFGPCHGGEILRPFAFAPLVLKLVGSIPCLRAFVREGSEHGVRRQV